MKKFISDNLWWMMIVAIALGAFALYKTMKKDEGENTSSLTIEKTEKSDN